MRKYRTNLFGYRNDNRFVKKEFWKKNFFYIVRIKIRLNLIRLMNFVTNSKLV